MLHHREFNCIIPWHGFRKMENGIIILLYKSMLLISNALTIIKVNRTFCNSKFKENEDVHLRANVGSFLHYDCNIIKPYCSGCPSCPFYVVTFFVQPIRFFPYVPKIRKIWIWTTTTMLMMILLNLTALVKAISEWCR